MKTLESCPEGAWQIALTEVLMRALPWTMLLGMGTILTAAPAQAQMYDPRYPVCMQVYSRDGSFIGCGYTSMAQCAATASGRAAQCFCPINGGTANSYVPHSRSGQPLGFKPATVGERERVEPTGWRWRYTSDAVDSHAKERVKRDGVRQALSEIWHQ